MADYSKWVLREGMKIYLKGNSEDYGIKGDNFEINSEAIITYAPHAKSKKISALLKEKDGDCFNRTIDLNRNKVKWNPENIKVVWDFNELSSFREISEMLKIFTFEQILNMWNDNETSSGRPKLFNIERNFDICYVDTDFEEFLDMLEEKNISIDIQYGDCVNKEGYVRFSDPDGAIFEVKTMEEENRFDYELPTETIVFWNSATEYVREKEKKTNLNNIITEAIEKQIQKLNLQAECDLSHPYKAMTIQVGFSHKENENDETEFCINTWDKKELAELFETFCKENHFEAVSINNLSIVRVASSLDKLTEMEENEEVPRCVFRRDMIEKWRNIYFEESETMIALLRNEEANELTKDEKEFLLEWSGDDEYAYVSDNGELVDIEDEEEVEYEETTMSLTDKIIAAKEQQNETTKQRETVKSRDYSM